MWDYTDKVREHYLHPKNVGEIANADGVGEVGNIKCGDALRLTFKLDSNKRINDIKFKTYGCGSAIAASSILTEMCKGKTLDEVASITNKDIADALGGLPKEKMHCSVMGQEALNKAIDYYKNGGKPNPEQEQKGHIVCACFNVTEEEIEQAIRQNNLKTVEEITNYTKAGGGCGGCIPQIEELLAKVTHTTVSTLKKPAAKQMTMVQKIDAIRTVLDTEVRPMLQKDGGDCELVDVDGNTVVISFRGHCKGCAMAASTQYDFIEKILQKEVSSDLVVKSV
ncbi:MAG: Fe-S cluster assembly protein NifU [Chitinivibrionales bacterium]|nr:Fe-S cluster assembly protein NifU [Chitinivibrionales bacterium]